MENTSILDLLNDMRKKCISSDDELINSLNISLAEYNFFLIFDENQTLSSEWISDKMNLSLSRVSRVIDRMVVNGFLIRKIDPSDRRAINLKLSEEGLSIYNKIKLNRIECEATIRAKLSIEEGQELESNLKLILSLL